MQVTLVQFDIAWENKAANHARIESMLDSAGVAPGSLVVLPEMADTGFSFDLEKTVTDQSAIWAGALAKRLMVWLQAGFAERGEDGRGRNCAALFGPDGVLVGRYHKVQPFSFGREAEYFSGGDHLLLAEIDSVTVAPLICYDLRFPELWRLASRAGAEVFTIGASWPAARQHHWRALAIARAIENQAYVVAVNRVGRDPTLAYAGGSLVVAPSGEIVAEARDGDCVLEASLDVPALRSWRRTFPALKDVRDGLLGSIRIERANRLESAERPA